MRLYFFSSWGECDVTAQRLIVTMLLISENVGAVRKHVRTTTECMHWIGRGTNATPLEEREHFIEITQLCNAKFEEKIANTTQTAPNSEYILKPKLDDDENRMG